jgi:oligopeptidase B
MSDSPMPPSAKREPTVTVLHGDERIDDYDWMREKDTPKVTEYLESENAYADAVMAPTKDLQERLYREMVGRIKEDDDTFPYRQNGWLYFSRTEAGKQYPLHYRKSSDTAPEAVLLDLNAMARGHPYMGLGVFQPSIDGKLLAYSTDNTGFREYTLRVKDMVSGEHLGLAAGLVGTVSWANDNVTLFYTVDDESKRPYRLFRHRLGTDVHDLLYEENDEMFRLTVHRSRSGEFMFLTISSHTTTEVHCLPTDHPQSEWKLISARQQEHEYYADHHGEHFYFMTNDTGRNFRIARAPLATPGHEHWEEVVRQRDDVMLEDLELWAGHMVVSERFEGLQRLRVTTMATGDTHEVAFPDPVYSVFTGPNRVWDTHLMRYTYQSLVSPPQVVDYDMETRQAIVRKQLEVPNYDPSLYESERTWVTARDGARIPVSVVSKRDAARDGSGPLLLQGYGSYGANYPIAFSSARMSLVDRGLTVAFAHVRGGGEMGKAWHDAGKMLKKITTFEDFIDVGEALIERGYTNRGGLIATGRSAGGLLMGAVANMRPELFKAIVADVPFVDVINTMLDASLPLTVGEWEEWGNPNIEEHYRYIRQYCPYTNVSAHDYPAIYVKTALNDSQVMYWEPAKWVAKLRANQTDSNPLVFRTDMGAGHGGASGRYDYLREVAEEYAFILWQAGKHTA